MFSSLFSFSLLALPLTAWATAHGSHLNRAHHGDIAKRQSGDISIHKRFSSARWSFYDVGLGACGEHNVENDFIVALNAEQFGGGYPGPNCFKTITMHYNGKSATATIMDRCPGCPYGGLDLSRGLFRHFASEGTGIIYGEWSFGGGGGGPPPPPPPPPPPKTTSKWTPPKPTFTWKPKPTTTWKPEPTTTWKPEPTSTKEEPKTTSTKTSSSSSSSSSSSAAPSSSAPPAIPTFVPNVTPDKDNGKNLDNLNRFFIQMGGILMAGAGRAA